MKIIPFIGRVFISIIFLISGSKKIMNFESEAEKMGETGMALPEVFLAGAIAFCLLGALSLILGYKTRLGAFLLIMFLVPTTLIFHLYPGEMTQVWKNVALLGGLLMVISNGPGAFSIDGETRNT